MAEGQGKESAPELLDERGTRDDPVDAERDKRPERRPADAQAGASPINAIPELMRRALTAGLSGFFLTEEAIRKALGDTLPKDWSDFATEQSSRARAEFLERLSYEIARALENVDYAAVLAQLLEGRTLEVSAKIRLAGEGTRGRRPRLRVDVSGEDESP